MFEVILAPPKILKISQMAKRIPKSQKTPLHLGEAFTSWSSGSKNSLHETQPIFVFIFSTYSNYMGVKNENAARG
jgi:hypothetical protein